MIAPIRDRIQGAVGERGIAEYLSAKSPVTRELLHRAMSDRGGLNNIQFHMLGEPWPPRAGWKKRVVGVVQFTPLDEQEFINRRET